MANNVLGALFQDIANAIRNKTGDTAKIVPADFPDEINSIVVGTSGGGGGTETGLGDLKIATGSFNSGTGYRKTITHGLGKMPDLIMVYYGNADWTYGAVQFSKMERFFAVGLHSSLQDVTSFKGCTNAFGIGTVQADYYMDEDGAVSTAFIYCTDEDTFSWGWPDDGSNTNGNGLMVANKTYHWLAISGMGGVIGGGGSVEAVAITSAKMVSNSNITWTLYDNGLLTFEGTGSLNNASNADAKYQEYKNFVTEARVGEGITEVGKIGLAYMQTLKKVTLPSTVTAIGSSAFDGCSALEEINLDNIESIDNYGFHRCHALNVVLPPNLKSLGYYGLGNTKTDTCNIPPSLTTIANQAFYGCDIVGEVIIPATVTSGTPYMFYGCKNITKITSLNSPTTFGFCTFTDMDALKECNIPSSVTSMGKNCFLRTTPTAVTFDDPNGWIVSTDSAGTAGVVELSSADLSDPVTAASLIVQYGGTHYFIKSA